jgi:hypothetical protein
MQLFSFLILLQLLNLSALLLDLLLLLLYLLLGLLIGGFLILHLVADHITGHAAERAADSCTRSGRSDCGTDNRASRRADTCAAEGTLFTGAERLSGTSGEDEKRYQSKCSREDGIAPHGLSLVNTPSG